MKGEQGKRRKSVFKILLGLVLLGVAAAAICLNTSRPQMYLPVTQDHNPNVPTNNPKCGDNYAFSVIEFDDLGEMWQREQLYRSLDLIAAAQSNGCPVTVMIFVHGWQNDASPQSANLREFQQFVTNIAQIYATNDSRILVGDDAKPRQFIGVYLAWRGHVYRNYPDWLGRWVVLTSFWNRKRIASQVAGVSCTEAILSLAAQTRAGYSNETEAATTPTTSDTATNRARSQVVLVGHSFGGLIVERAVTQAMLGNMLANVHAHGGGFWAHYRARKEPNLAWRPRPPFDMVLLVNPASESLVARKMIEAMDNPLVSRFSGVTNDNSRPWIISVSSTGDWATRWAFPIGRKLGSWMDQLRVYEPPVAMNHSPTNFQATFYNRTAPQNDSMLTHHIGLAGPLNNSHYDWVDQEHQYRWLLRVNLDTTKTWQGTNHFHLTNEFLIANPGGQAMVYAVVPDGGADPKLHPGYWIVQAPPEIIPDHTTIFTKEFYAMSAGLFRMTQYHPAERDHADQQREPEAAGTTGF